MFGVLDNLPPFGQNWPKKGNQHSYFYSQIDTLMMPNMSYGIILLMWSSNLFIWEQERALGRAAWDLETWAQKWAAVINMCPRSRIKTAVSKSHNRRSCCSSESDMNTYEDLVFFVFFFLALSSNGAAAAVLAFVLWCVYPPLPPPIKGLSVQPWFISWIKQDSIILLTDGIKINSCELRGTLNVLTHTHTHTYTQHGRPA